MNIILHKDFLEKALAFQLISFGFHWHWNNNVAPAEVADAQC